MDSRSNAQESGVILVPMIHARNHTDADDTRTLRQSCRRGGESLGWQRVSYDCDFIGRESSGNEAIGGGLRVADNGVTPAKSGSLRAELR
jgi:hypothetical protein